MLDNNRVVSSCSDTYFVSVGNSDDHTVFSFLREKELVNLRCYRTQGTSKDPDAWLAAIPDSILLEVAMMAFETTHAEGVKYALLGSAISVLLGYAPDARELDKRLAVRQLAMHAVTVAAIVADKITLPDRMPTTIESMVAMFGAPANKALEGKTLPLTADGVVWHKGMSLWEEGWIDDSKVRGLRCITAYSDEIEWIECGLGEPGAWYTTPNPNGFLLSSLYSSRKAAVDELERSVIGEYNENVFAVRRYRTSQGV